MGKTLIIVRHGNTFLPGQTPTRVGARTDLPLVEEGRARAVGRYLLANRMVPDRLYAAPLKRTMQTAQLIADEAKPGLQVTPAADFTEIDYGPDENQTEDRVRLRLGCEWLHGEKLPVENLSDEQIMAYGERILEKWNACAEVPAGWRVDPEAIVRAWRSFAEAINEGETVLICTSNGIIRFAPHLLNENYEAFCRTHDIKAATGSVSVFRNAGAGWECAEWNAKPYKNDR